MASSEECDSLLPKCTASKQGFICSFLQTAQLGFCSYYREKRPTPTWTDDVPWAHFFTKTLGA